MASRTEICNLALGFIGVQKSIQNLASEQTAEAVACRRFFDTARDELFRVFPWPFATKIVTLNLVAEDPTEEWKYSYRVPSDYIRLRRIPSGVRNDTRNSFDKYRITQDDEGLLIYTDKEDAEMEYTFREGQVIRWPSDFQTALAYKLATYILPSLSRGDPFKMGPNLEERYLIALTTAQANAANEEMLDQEPDSELIRERE